MIREDVTDLTAKGLKKSVRYESIKADFNKVSYIDLKNNRKKIFQKCIMNYPGHPSYKVKPKNPRYKNPNPLP